MTLVRWSVCFSLLVGLCLTGWAFAADPIPYHIGTGDLLQVNIWQEPDLTGTYPVAKDGTVTINWLEPVKIEGLSLDDAKKVLTKAIGQYVKQPVVTITVAEYRSQKVTILGEVKNPGQYFLKNDASLLNLLLRDAGGTTAIAGDAISIVHASKGPGGTPETITIDRERLLQGDPTQNIVLQGGDTILVPQGTGRAGTSVSTINSVFVVGEVVNNGSFKVREGYTVMSAILDAGGFTKFAAQNRVKLVRMKGEKKEEFVIKMKDILHTGDRTKDMTVMPGDQIIVPRSLL